MDQNDIRGDEGLTAASKVVENLNTIALSLMVLNLMALNLIVVNTIATNPANTTQIALRMKGTVPDIGALEYITASPPEGASGLMILDLSGSGKAVVDSSGSGKVIRDIIFGVGSSSFL